MTITTAQGIEIVSHVISAATVLAAITPNRFDNLVLDIARKVLDVLAFNYGFSRNAQK